MYAKQNQKQVSILNQEYQLSDKRGHKDSSKECHTKNGLQGQIICKISLVGEYLLHNSGEITLFYGSMGVFPHTAVSTPVSTLSILNWLSN